MCAAQSSKTQTIMNLLSWSIVCDPGPAMWVMAAQDEAKTFAKTRLIPTLENCEPVAALFPRDRHSKTILEINFDTMPLIINGANSQSKLQSKPIRRLFLDEARNYPPGALEMVLKRTRTFWNAKRVIVSTPDLEGDAVHSAFLAGDQRHYYVPCISCRHEEPLVLKNFKWDTNDFTRPNDQWNFDALATTIRLECSKCGFKHEDKPDVRREIAASGRWVKHNLNAPSNRASFTWPAFLPPWVQWRSLIEEFLKARQALKVGTIIPLKSFINESLGQPWQDNYSEDKEVIVKSDYSSSGVFLWPDEAQRFLTVDVQKDHFWYVCRAWSKIGTSRLIREGRLDTFEDITEIQKNLNIIGHRVLVDSGYNTSEVYQKCLKYGWIPLKGQDRDFFPSPTKEGAKMIWTPMARVDVGLGTVEQGMYRLIKPILFASPTCKDMLARIRKTQLPKWEIPTDISQEYLWQMDSEIKKLRHNKLTGQEVWQWCRIGSRPNHLFDCELMQIVAAVMAKLLARAQDA